ncbi:MAG: DUF4258 domain-containing protein [Candidatus Schekmanbacteria bacterium]|nr:DUF4258 domain-containing protein [Candidatus Schekmanbacteria bacterium]
MNNFDAMLEQIKKSAAKRIIESEHCINKRFFTNISKDDILNVIFNGIIIENYPEDKRGRSCLMARQIQGKMIHVCCSPKEDHLKLITVYQANNDVFENDLITRRKRGDKS